MKSTFLMFLALVITLQLLPIESIYAQSTKKQFEFSPYIKLNSFGWKEFDDNGNELLSESGFIFGFGSEGKYFLSKKKNLYLQSDLQLYSSKVDYDGFLQDNQGNRTPYKSKSVYFGIEFLVNAGYLIKLEKKVNLIPFAGIGIEYWLRDIDDGGRAGYDEKYTTFYFNLASQIVYILSKKISLNSALQIKIPLSISEHIDGTSHGNTNIVDINLSPGITPRIYFDIGANIHNFTAALFFETWLLSKSNEDKGFHQPESSRKWFGLKLGYSFWL